MVKNTFLPVVIFLVVLATAPSVSAELCVPDHVPAATLLVPYFEVDPGTCGGANPRGTIITVHNDSAQSRLAQVTLWTDVGVDFTSFIVYLAGHASHRVDLAQFFCFGDLPSTGSAVSVGGPLADSNLDFPSCNSTDDPSNGPPVYGGVGAVPQYFLDGLQSVFSGGPWINGTCAGLSHGDGLLRGYVTIDVVNACSYVLPSNPGYFVSGGSGIAANDNVLLGEYTSELPPSESGGLETQDLTFPAVHIEAGPAGFFPPNLFPVGTFYGRFVAGSAVDDREPLPTEWLVRHDANSTMTVWRQVPEGGIGPFACGSMPYPFPLALTGEQNFDNQGQLWEPQVPPIPPPDPPPPRLIAFATQRIQTGPQSFYPGDPPPASFDTGWQRFLFSTTSSSLMTGQSWVTVETSSDDGDIGRQAIAVDSSCEFGLSVPIVPSGPLVENPNVLLIFRDDFETGNVSGWSTASN